MRGGASVTGILLAPRRAVSLSSSTVTGEILSGGSGINNSQADKKDNFHNLIFCIDRL